MTAAAITGVLKPILGDVNMVSAPVLAKDRGIQIETISREQQGAYESYIRLTVITERQKRSVAGTVFAGGNPRIVQVKGIDMEAELTAHMLYITNEDKPGFIGRLGTLLGNLKVNIANFNLGRLEEGADAIALIAIDSEMSDGELAQISALEAVKQVKGLRF
jgi:D-3-phosphoglycerate dehydrogenase